MKKENLKSIDIIGRISSHQWGAVVNRGGTAYHDEQPTQDAAFNYKEVKKKIVVVGDLEVGGERGRVFMFKGISSSITATEYKDPMKVVKKWKRK